MSTTTAQKQIAPAGSHVTGGEKLDTYDNSSTEVKTLVRALNKFASAKTLEEHTEAMRGFDEDMSLDTPFLQVQGRERIRILTWLTKQLWGHYEIEPKVVKIKVGGGEDTPKGGIVDVDGIVHWKPSTYWYNPVTWFLPKDIPIFADVSVGVKAHNDKVSFVSGKNHNLPHFSKIVRVLLGYTAGMGVTIAEPIVQQLWSWYTAGMEGVSSATESARDTAGSAIGSARDAAASAHEKVKDITTPIVDKVADKVPMVGQAAQTVGLSH